MKVISSDYTHGCNFASSGSTATNITPFSLSTQVNQFLRFRSTVLETLHESAPMATTNDSTIANSPGHILSFEHSTNCYFHVVP